jgi:hypothetical protein
VVRKGSWGVIFRLALLDPAYKYAIFNNGFNFTAVENKESTGKCRRA